MDEPLSPTTGPDRKFNTTRIPRRHSRPPNIQTSLPPLRPHVVASASAFNYVNGVTFSAASTPASNSGALSPPLSPHTPSKIVDRIHTPGKLRAFFDDVKRIKSAGAVVSIPDKYKDMIIATRGDITKSEIPQSFTVPTKLSAMATSPPLSPEAYAKSAASSPKKHKVRKEPSFNTLEPEEIEAVSSWKSDVMQEDWVNLTQKSFTLPAKPKPLVPISLQKPVLPPVVKKADLPERRESTVTHIQSTKQTASEEEGESEQKKRSPTPDGCKRCIHCERTFASDRLGRHEAACQMNPSTSKKKRKPLTGSHFRVIPNEDGSITPYNPKNAKKKEIKMPPKKDWRKQHEEFIQAIRAAKSS